MLNYYLDGFNLNFIKDEYKIVPEGVKYILRGYSDRYCDDEYYFNMDWKTFEGYFIKPENNVEDIMLLAMLNTLEIPFRISNEYYVFNGCNLIDFVYTIFNYEMEGSEDFFTEFLYKYDKYKTSVEFHYTLNDPQAVPPTKNRYSDTGYDLTVIGIKKKMGNTCIYDTGVSVKPADGYYFDVVPRSSISKMGYIQTNSVGIIDSGYRGNIMIALTKINDEIPDIEMGTRVAQIIPRKLELVKMIEVDSLDESKRNSDGGICRN